MRKTFKPASQTAQTLKSLKDQALNLLAEVNYLLTKTDKIKESIIVIGLPHSGKTSVIEALTLNKSLNSQHNSNIYLPQKFEINDKVFWECSNKIKPSITDKESILQVLVNMFFIKNLMTVSEKLKFIIVVQEKTIINDDNNNFTSIIEDFISIFPKEEHLKLQNNVICVVTQFNEDTREQFLESLKSKKGVLEYFPTLFTNLKYLHSSTSQKDNTALSLKLEDIDLIPSSTKINVNKLELFLGTQDTLKLNQELVQTLYKQIKANVFHIYDIIKSIFTIKDKEDFDIYNSCNCSEFLENNNYNNYVQNFLFKLKPNHAASEKILSKFQGLQQLSEIKTILEKQNQDVLSDVLGVLSIIKKFANNTQINDYYYILNQQIKELLLFGEAMSFEIRNDFYHRSKTIIEICKSFIEKNYFSSIKNIQPKGDESIEVCREVIDLLDKYPDPNEITKIKAIYYSQIGDVYSQAKYHKEALANYNLTREYDKNFKEICTKIADQLVKLDKRELAIEYYKIDNEHYKILECFKTLLKHDPKNVNLYIQKGDYLLSQAIHNQNLYQKAAYAYFLAMGLAQEKENILYQAINALKKIPVTGLELKHISPEERDESTAKIIGEYFEI